MTTSLAAQLEKLAVPQTSLLLRDKKRASLLFDPKEAAGIDRDTFYDIGISGLTELEKFNTEFTLFENSLFSTTSRQIERAVENAETNAKLNKNIRKFLLLLSPYFLLKPAHKALEWLIHRFSIHEYNKEDVLKLILPYHETNIFVKFLQILNVRNENDRWHWMRPLQKGGIHLPKLTLFNHAGSNVGFLQFIGDMTLQAVKENGVKANTLTTLFTFYCTCTIGALEHSSDVSEPQITAILPPLLKGVSSDIPDFKASSYMITAQLLKKCRPSHKILNQLVSKLTNGNQTHLRTEATLLLVLIYQSQQDSYNIISEKSLNHLVSNDWFAVNLGKLAASGTFVMPLLKPLFKALLENIEGEDKKKLVDSILMAIRFDDATADVIIRSVLDSCPNVKSTNKPTAQWCSDLLKRLETKYPAAFDKVVREVMSSKASNKHRQALSSYLNFIMSVCPKKGNIDIFEKLYHPNPEFRANAVNFLVKNYPTLSRKEQDIFKGGIEERLLDDNKEVVKAVLTLKRKYLAQLLGKDHIVELLIKLLSQCQKKNWLDVCTTVITLLCNVKVDSKTQIFLAILPFVLPTTNEELIVALNVLKTEYSNECAVLRIVKSEVPKIITPYSFCESIYKAMSEQNCLPEFNLLIKALDKVTQKDVIHNYISAILISCALPNNSNMGASLKILQNICRYISSLNIVALRSDIRTPIATKCIIAVKEGNIPLEGILVCIKMIIDKTEKVNLSGKWLNLTMPDETITFLTHMFVFLLNGCSNKNHAVLYGIVLKSFFHKFCPEFKDTIEFLANILIAQDFENLQITVESQLRTSKVLHEIINRSNKSVSWALDLSSPILVPAVLIGLANPIHEIRTVTVQILSHISNTVSLKTTDTFTPLLQELMNRKEEILLDNEQLALILFSIFEEQTDKKYKNILNALVDIASDVNIPIHVTASLLKILAFINSGEILTRTSKLALSVLKTIDNAEIIVDRYQSSIIYNVILRFNEITASAITLQSPIWEMLSLAIKQDISSLEYSKGKYACPSVLVLEQIDRTVFANLEFDVQHVFIKLLAEIVTEADNPEVVSAVSHVVKKIDLDAKLLIDGLTAMRDAKSDKAENNQRKARRATLIPTVDILDNKEWIRGVAMLEFIQDKKKISNTGLLLPVLFGILKKCLDFDEQAAVEYPKQLLLSAILHCCIKMENETQVVSASTFNMELVVQCVRASQNPQTHHHALLVLAHTAALIPEQVLHNIMAIFTFMGSSVLRHDDAYSFQIISKIIDTVIPILVQVKSDENDMELNVAGVLRVFVDVLLDVPEHRRMPLFTKLITTLDVDQYLWLFLLLVFEAHVVHGNVKQKPTKNRLLNSENVPQRLTIATDLTLEYPPKVVINTTIKLLDYLKKLPDEKNDNMMEVETSTFNIKKYTPKQFRHYKYTLVTFLSGLLQAKQLVNHIAVMNNQESLSMESLYKNMIINILTYIQSISKTVDRSSGTPQAQYWKVMLHHSYDILDSVNALLTKEMFLLVIRGLVVHNIQTVRRKALELLNTKLQHQPSFFYTNPTDEEITETDDLFAVLPSLIDIIKTINKENVEPEQELIQQTSLLSLKLLIKLLADKNQEKFIPLLEFITDLIKSDKAQGNILASVVLCLAELVSYLRAHAIPGLVKFMPAIIKVLKVQKHQESPNLLLMCTITAIQKIVESLPLFLSPYLEKLLCELSVLSSKWEEDESNQKVGPFVTKLKGIRCNIGNTIPPRVLIPIIGQTYNTLLKSKNYNSIGALMNVLSENLTNVRGQELTVLLPELTTFFLTALQFRTDSNETIDLTQINIVEDHVIKALTVLVLKLSETTFRPFYYRLYDWAVRSDSKTERVITFYRLSAGIAGSLKGLFVLFAGHFVKNAASILDECNTYKNETLYFEDETKCILLIESVLKTLKTVFTFDSQSFVDKDRFEAIMQPLVDQLENKIGGLQTLSCRANDLIIPCIAQFAISTADDTLWKQLNYQVLLKTRHDLPVVRLVGLNCVSAVAHKIGEDFLPLLPETIPFLAELLEDEDENVESSCQKVVQDLEKVLGEPLQKYF